MKKTIFTMALAALMLAGCSQEESLPTGEEVKMTFTANLSTGVQSRADGEETLLANQMVIGIYEKKGDNYVLAKKQTPEAIESNNPKCQVTLIKGASYKLVFWAYNQQKEQAVPYNLDDLEAISINSTDGNLEAFTVAAEVTGGVNNQTEITLHRPVAQVRFGTVSTDWAAASTLGKTPASATIKLAGCPDSYNALTGEVSTTATKELSFTTSSLSDENKFTASETEYINFGTCYTFASNEDNGGSKITCTLVVNQKDETKSFFTDTYSEVTVKPNHRTNIIGNLMTGTATYTVTIPTDGYTDIYPENNE